MKIIADSGSTKTDWRILNSSEIIPFKTIGLSPYFVSNTNITEIVLEQFPSSINTNNISEIFFYGSGCKAQESKNIISNALKAIFPTAVIHIESDLVGAAISQLGDKAGLITILGTGMNVGYWNGSAIEYSITSLGFILGDEGSGAYLGKKLLKRFFEGDLSDKASKALTEAYNLSLDETLNAIYKDEFPNRYLASFVPFIEKNISDYSIRTLLKDSFKRYIEKHILKISKKYDIYTISIIGSIGYYFQEILTQECKEHGIITHNISQSPIDNLCSYHAK